MKPETINKLTDRLIEHEGLRLKPYRCPAGKLTIGVGRNLEDKGITKEEALLLLENDIMETKALCEKNFPFFNRLDENRKSVLVEMCFNMGISRLKGFRLMLEAVEHEDFLCASKEMLNSKWAHQVGKRALRLASMMQGSRRLFN